MAADQGDALSFMTGPPGRRINPRIRSADMPGMFNHINGRVSSFASAALISALLAACSGSAPAPAAATPEVEAAAAIGRQVSSWQTYSGRLQAIDHVDIHAQVPGTIEQVFFKDGQMVKKGDPLFLIDPRTYAAAVEQANGQLAAAQARARFSSTDFTRAQKLLTGNAISQRDFDQRDNGTKAAAADVKAAEAALAAAKVNLDYTRITAPVDGRMSRAELTVGNVVAAGVTSRPLTTLVSVTPIYAGFDVDEQTYLRYLAGKDAQTVQVKLGLANESAFSRTGKISSVDNELNGTTGTIRVRAVFDNADGKLLPGLYARVAVGGGEPHAAVLIDDRAVSTDQAKKFVLVVDDKDHAQYREVTLGNIVDGLREIESGLKAGERVVVNGLQRVHPGDAVKAKIVPMAGESAVAEKP
jgi:multidrug efflux system membrane fusion protein